MAQEVEHSEGTVPSPAIAKRSVGRILLDAFSETILNVLFFILGFVGWSIRWTVAAVLLIAAMCGVAYYVFMEQLQGGQYVTVPNIVDQPITDASFLLAEQGLELGKQAQVAHPTVPRYYVIAQNPAPGRVVRTGRKVYATISLGKDFLQSPALTGRTLEDAQREIVQSRFRMGSVARIPHEAQRDTVIAQDPPPGANIPNQGSINLLVSAGNGNENTFMPDIRGKSVQEALALLEPYSVTLVPNVVDIPGAQVDTVLNQDPAPDTMIAPGQTVRYDVKPSGAVTIPDSRQTAEVRHVMPYDWYDRDVRVDVIDSSGNRSTVWTKQPLYDDPSKMTYIAGSAIRIPVTYLGQAVVEIYINGQLDAAYDLKGADPPKRR